MKTLAILLLSIVASFGSDMWTFHVPSNLPCSFSSNWQTADPSTGGERECLAYDTLWAVDSDGNPVLLPQGWYSLHIYPGWISNGWQPATNSITPDFGFSYLPDAWMDSGYPDYFGGGYVNVSVATEYWLDFDSTGTPRESTSQPVDFGKYLWDGSINPSWTAAKKGFAKGHNKQPLPTTK